MIRYQSYEWDDIAIHSQADFGSTPTVLLYQIVPGNPMNKTQLSLTSSIPIIIYAGPHNETVYGWSMQQSGLSAPSSVTTYFWVMQDGSAAGLDSGYFVVHGYPNELRWKASGGDVKRYSWKDIDKIVCVGGGFEELVEPYIYINYWPGSIDDGSTNVLIGGHSWMPTERVVASGTRVWLSKGSGFDEWLALNLVSSDYPAIFTWIMKPSGGMEGPTAYGAFIVDSNSGIERFPVYGAGDVSKIICIGENLPPGAPVNCGLYRITPGATIPTITTIGVTNSGCVESSASGTEGVYLWSAQTDAVLITNPNEPTLYLWQMVSGGPVAYAYGFFLVSETTPSTDYSDELNTIISKLNLILTSGGTPKPSMQYPGSITVGGGTGTGGGGGDSPQSAEAAELSAETSDKLDRVEKRIKQVRDLLLKQSEDKDPNQQR